MARLAVTAFALALAGTGGAVMWDARADAGASPLFFVTGFASSDTRLDVLAQDANLRLEIATRAAGAMLGALVVSVVGRVGQRVLHAALAGPWLIARLPPGRYRVIVEDGERRQEQSVWLTASALRTVRFVW